MDDVKKRFESILEDATTGSNVHDFELRKAVASLGLSVMKLDASIARLDSSSSRLAKVYIWLTVALLVVGVLQVVMLFVR